MDLTVGISRNGRGILALRDFAPEEILYEVTGVLVTCDEDEDMDDSVRSNTFRYSEDLYMSPSGTIGDFQNHSCEPNAKVVKIDDRLFVAAVQAIQKGHEVLIDYSTIIAPDDIWEMRCACGAQSCRGVVQKYDMLPASLRQKYEREHIVPQYILEV